MNRDTPAWCLLAAAGAMLFDAGDWRGVVFALIAVAGQWLEGRSPSIG